jgi:iron complex outermembrane receptor protein
MGKRKMLYSGKLFATCAISVLALATAPAGHALAQSTPAVTPAPDATLTPSLAAGEIVVTAQKRVERLQDVPISMEVVTGAKLDAFHATDFKSIMNYTPNVFVETTAGNDVIYIRGFGSPPSNFAFDQSVSLYVDGVYAGRSRQDLSPFFDLQRVEVLRGPQGALFGKNTPAGAVSVVSAGPTQTFQGSLNADYNFDLKGYDLSGFVSGPITPDLTARLAVRLLDQDGYLTNTFDGKHEPQTQQQDARLTLKYAPAGPFDYTVKVDYGDRTIKGGIDVSEALTDSSQNAKTTRYIDDSTPLGPEGQKTSSWIISGTGNLRLGDFTLTSVSGYSYFNSDIVNGFDQSIPGGGVTNQSVYNGFPETFRQISQEVRLLSPVGQKLEYTVGGYYDNSYYDLTQNQGFNIPALGYAGLEQTVFRQRAQTLSAFAQGTYHLLDNLRIIGSVRYTDTDKRAYFTGSLISGPFPLQPLTNANGKLSEGDTDPSVTLQYDVVKHVMLYATYGKGSKSGGFVSNTFGTTDATFQFQPEKSENYEVGVKSTLLSGKLVLDAAVYDTKFTDLQVSVYNPATSTYQTGNAASASSKGIEASAAWYPMPNLDFTASAAYQDVKYDDYPGAACLATESLAQCNPAVPASIQANNNKGEVLPYTSKFTGSFQTHYRYDLPNDYRVDSTVNVAGRSKYFDSDNESPTWGSQQGYAKVDLRIQFAPSDQHWHIALVGKNLTNELTTGSSFNLPAPITSVPRAILYVEEGRNIAIEAGMKF